MYVSVRVLFVNLASWKQPGCHVDFTVIEPKKEMRAYFS